MITQQVGGVVAKQAAVRLGISESTANTAVQMAIPLIVAALARNAAKPEGAQALQQAVVKDHDGSIFDNLLSHFTNPATGDGAGILQHALGGERQQAENNLAQAAGVDQNTAGSVMEMVAPLVMGALGRTQQQSGLDANGLSQFLGEEQKAQAAAAPGLMGMLDSNNDGSVVDDIGRIAGNFFK
jgi:hypothetical protein